MILPCDYHIRIAKIMTIEDLMGMCTSLNAVTTDIKWEDHLCFNLGGKMFLITSPDNFPPTASIKVTEEDFDLLTDREGISPASYLARYKWIALDDINRLSKTEWEKYISISYKLIASKLSKHLRTGLGID